MRGKIWRLGQLQKVTDQTGLCGAPAFGEIIQLIIMGFSDG